MNVPVASLPVKKKVVAVRLVFVEVKAPDVPVIPDEEIDGRITGGAGSQRQKVPHLTWILSSSWFRELELEKKMVSFRERAVIKPDAKPERKIVAAISGRRNKFRRIDREFLPRLRSGDVFVAKRIKAVIRTYKEILAGDMRGVVKRRLMAYYGLCKGIPDQLNGMVQRPPGSKRPPVNFELLILAGSSREVALGFVLVVAAPVHVIESQVSHGAPTIGNQHRWLETRHIKVSSNCSLASGTT